MQSLNNNGFWNLLKFEAKMLYSSNKQTVKLGDIFMREAGVLCIILLTILQANAEFSAGKHGMNEWKADYIKRHLIYPYAVNKWRKTKTDGILHLITDTDDDRETRVKLREQKKSNADIMMKMLMDYYPLFNESLICCQFKTFMSTLLSTSQFKRVGEVTLSI